METFYIDSNYWIYWFGQRLPEHRYVNQIMQRAIRSEVVINTVTIMEVAHYFRRFPKDEFTKRMPEILNLSTTGIMNLTIEIMEESLSLVLQYSNF